MTKTFKGSHLLHCVNRFWASRFQACRDLIFFKPQHLKIDDLTQGSYVVLVFQRMAGTDLYYHDVELVRGLRNISSP
jgi:hypothetical protein